MYGRVVCDRTPEAPAKNLAKYSRNSHVTFSRPPPFNDEGRWSRRMRRWCKWRDLETKYNKKKNRKIPPVPASLPHHRHMIYSPSLRYFSMTTAKNTKHTAKVAQSTEWRKEGKEEKVKYTHKLYLSLVSLQPPGSALLSLIQGRKRIKNAHKTGGVVLSFLSRNVRPWTWTRRTFSRRNCVYNKTTTKNKKRLTRIGWSLDAEKSGGRSASVCINITSWAIGCCCWRSSNRSSRSTLGVVRMITVTVTVIG